MTGSAPPPPSQEQPHGFWYTLWTASKLIMVLSICVPVVVLMLNSSQPTSTPTAPIPDTPTGVPPTPTAGPSPTALPTQVRFTDVFVPGTLIYVQGRTLVKLRHKSEPVHIAYNAAQPAISPDGKRVAYVQFQKNYSDLYLLDLRSGRSRPLTHDTLRDPADSRTGLSAGSPAWSDDGSAIFFTWNAPGFVAGVTDATTTNITDMSIYRCPWRAACDSQSTQQIAAPGYVLTGGYYDPAPRPADANTLLYTRYAYATIAGGQIAFPSLIAHDLSGATAEQQLTDPGDAVSQPAWNRTGRYLAFVKTAVDQTTNALYAMPFHPPGSLADYAHATLLRRGTPLIAHPIFSPDGHWLAFLANGDDGTGFHLYLARVHLGRHPFLEKPRMVTRAGTVDSDRLAWIP